MMIIVTGGAGFIGCNIIKALNERGITDILVIDNLRNGNKFMNLVDLNISDYIDKEVFLKKITTNRELGHIEAIFHEGACSYTTELDGKYIMNNNYQYSKELQHYCLNRKIPFLYASSAAIYGHQISNCIELREYEKPLNIYGYSKFLFDEYTRKILQKTTSQIVGLRYFNVYGPHEEHKGDMASVVFHINTQLNNNESPKLFKGSENFKRDFIYIDDVVNVNLWFFENGISGIFNLGSGYAESFQKVAEISMSYYKKSDIEYIPLPNILQSCYQTFTKANLTKLRSVGYKKPFKTIKEGIKKYMSWLNHNIHENNL